MHSSSRGQFSGFQTPTLQHEVENQVLKNTSLSTKSLTELIAISHFAENISEHSLYYSHNPFIIHHRHVMSVFYAGMRWTV